MKIALGLLLAVSMLAAQNANDTPEAHVALAKTAAGEDYQNLFNFLCAVPGPRGGAGGGGVGRGGGAGAAAPRGQGGGQRQGPPDRSTWYAEPVKVFDNFYFVGQTEYSVWAVTTSEGIIVIDTIFDYSVEEEVAGGLKKLGLDPANIGRIDQLILCMQEKLKVTSIVVTHDLPSAFRISNRLALVYNRKIEFVGTVEEFKNSKNKAVTDFCVN